MAGEITRVITAAFESLPARQRIVLSLRDVDGRDAAEVCAMLDRDEFVELVTAFLDGALDPDTETRFLAHLAECSGCETYLDQFRHTIDTLGELPPATLSDEARDQLLTAFRDWPRTV